MPIRARKLFRLRALLFFVRAIVDLMQGGSACFFAARPAWNRNLLDREVVANTQLKRSLALIIYGQTRPQNERFEGASILAIVDRSQ